MDMEKKRRGGKDFNREIKQGREYRDEDDIIGNDITYINMVGVMRLRYACNRKLTRRIRRFSEWNRIKQEQNRR